MVNHTKKIVDGQLVQGITGYLNGEIPLHNKPQVPYAFSTSNQTDEQIAMNLKLGLIDTASDVAKQIAKMKK